MSSGCPPFGSQELGVGSVTGGGGGGGGGGASKPEASAAANRASCSVRMPKKGERRASQVAGGVAGVEGAEASSSVGGETSEGVESSTREAKNKRGGSHVEASPAAAASASNATKGEREKGGASLTAMAAALQRVLGDKFALVEAVPMYQVTPPLLILSRPALLILPWPCLLTLPWSLSSCDVSLVYQIHLFIFLRATHLPHASRIAVAQVRTSSSCGWLSPFAIHGH